MKIRFVGINYLFVMAIAMIALMTFGLVNAFAPGGGRMMATDIADNVIYTAWPDPDDDTKNMDIMFMSNSEAGYINISNSPATYSDMVTLTAEGKTVVVDWWEQNADGGTYAVQRISYDGGLTFGPIITMAELEDR